MLSSICDLTSENLKTHKERHISVQQRFNNSTETQQKGWELNSQWTFLLILNDIYYHNDTDWYCSANSSLLKHYEHLEYLIIKLIPYFWTQLTRLSRTYKEIKVLISYILFSPSSQVSAIQQQLQHVTKHKSVELYWLLVINVRVWYEPI